MKKVIFLAVFALVLSASCKKEKDCKCVTTMDGQEVATTEVTIDEGDCSDGNSTVTTLGITTTTTCTEK